MIWDVVEITVGRLPTQDLQVADEEVSREHAIFRREGESYSVEDLRTGLGTEVNGERIQGRCELGPGDRIQIGSLKLEFAMSEGQVPRGPHVRFGSELKGYGLPSGDGDAGSTMLGLAPDDMLAATTPAPRAAEPVALSASGALEASVPRDLDDLFDDPDEPGGFAIGNGPDDVLAAAPAQAPAPAPVPAPALDRWRCAP